MRYVLLCGLLAACAESTPLADGSIDFGAPRADADVPRIDASGPSFDGGSPRVDAAPPPDAPPPPMDSRTFGTTAEFCDGLAPAFCSTEERCGSIGFADCETELARACCEGIFDCNAPLEVENDIIEECYEAIRNTTCENRTEVPFECNPIFEAAGVGGP